MLFKNLDMPRCDIQIKVIGIGGCGIDVVNNMLNSHIQNLKWMVVASDADALNACECSAKWLIGKDSHHALKAFLKNADILLIVARLGGKTAAQTLPVIAQLAQQNHILTIALIDQPLPVADQNHQKLLADGMREWAQVLHSFICICHDQIRLKLGGLASIQSIDAAANTEIQNTVKSIAELTTLKGIINLDFADLDRVMRHKGRAVISTACASGEYRASQALEMALSNPLFANANIQSAQAILINIISDGSLEMQDLDMMHSRINEISNETATVLVGCGDDDAFHDQLVVTVIAAGLSEAEFS